MVIISTDGYLAHSIFRNSAREREKVCVRMGENQRRIAGVESRLSPPLACPFDLHHHRPSSSNSLLSNDSIFPDYPFDLSFLTSDDHPHSPRLDYPPSGRGVTTLPQEGSQLYGQTNYASETMADLGASLALPAKDQWVDPENVESVLKVSRFPDSDLRSTTIHANSPPQVSLAVPVIPTDQFHSEVTLDEECSTYIPPTSVLRKPGKFLRKAGKFRATNNCSMDNVYFGDGDADGQLPYAKDPENVESVLKVSRFPDSDLRSTTIHANSPPQVSLTVPVIPTDQFHSEVTLDEECSTYFPPTTVLRKAGKFPGTNNCSMDNVYCGDGDADGQLPYAKDKAACLGKALVDQTEQKTNDEPINESNCNPLFSKASELHIWCPERANVDKLDPQCTNKTVLVEKSSLPSDQSDSEVDSPCWKGTQSLHAVATTSRSMGQRHFTDDLNCLHRLNPLAPHFLPANAKRSLDKYAKDCEENSSSSLQKPMSSNFPLLTEDYREIDPLRAMWVPPRMSETIKNHTSGETNKAKGASIQPDDADRSSVSVSRGGFSKVGSRSDSTNVFQISKRLDPSAPKFFPASAKLGAAVLEKQSGGDDMVAFETDAPLTVALSSLGNGLLDSVKAETYSADVSSSFWNSCSNDLHGRGSSYSSNPPLGSEVGISESVNIETSSNELHGTHRLNPLAPEFLLAGTKPNAYCHERNLITDNSLPVMNTALSSTLFVDTKDKAVDAAGLRSQPSVPMTQPQSSVCAQSFPNGVHTTQMEFALPNKLLGSSSLISSAVDRPAWLENLFASSQQRVVGPKTMVSMMGNTDIERFCAREDTVSSFSSDVGDSSGYSQNTSHIPSLTPSPKMDVKRLLETMLGLSELLTLLRGHSYISDMLNEEEFVLVQSIVKNLNIYIRNRTQNYAGNDSSHLYSSYNPKQLANPPEVIHSSALLRNHQPGGANKHMGVAVWKLMAQSRNTSVFEE